MPGVNSYSPNDKAIREAANTEIAARKAWHDKAWLYYEGKHQKPLKPAKNKVDNNVIINKIKPHVESTISFAAPSFPLLTLANGQPIPDELANAWRRNRQDVWISNVMKYGVLEGHCFVRVVPPTTGDKVRLVNVNPGNIIPFWQEDDYEQVLWYELRYMKGSEKRCQHIIAPGVDGNGGWEIREYLLASGDVMTLIDDPIAVSYRPIVDWQHLPHPARYQGENEMGGLGLNDSINAVASDIKAILRTHASPKLILKGVDNSEIKETAIDAVFTIPEDGEAKQLEMTGDLGSSMAFLSMLSQEYAEQARVVYLTGGPDQYKGITNLGIRAAFKSQIEKTETIRRQYSWGIEELSKAMMGALSKNSEIDIECTWADNLPVSEIEIMQIVQGERNMGLISKPTAAAELGLDWGNEKDLLDQEAENMPDNPLLDGVR